MKMKRIKGRNFTDRETRIFLDVIEPYMKILENKKTDGGSVKEKNLIWDCIYKKFNSCSYYERTVTQLKTYYDNFKRKARRHSIGSQESHGDSNSIDGIIRKTLDENENRLLLLLKQVEPINNSYESSREFQERFNYSASEASELIENKVLEPMVLTHLPSEKIENNISPNERLDDDSLNAPITCHDETPADNEGLSTNPFNDLHGYRHRETEMSNIELEYSRVKLELKKIELKRTHRDMEEKDELFILAKKKLLNDLVIQENEIRKQELEIKKKEYELKMFTIHE